MVDGAGAAAEVVDQVGVRLDQDAAVGVRQRYIIPTIGVRGVL